MGGGRSYTIQALDRAIDILRTFSQEHPELTLGEISERTGLPKPTAHRLLATLKRRRLVIQNPVSTRYELGFEILTLAAVRAGQTRVRDRAIRYMRGIRDIVNETVVLSVREGDYRVHLDQVESRHPFRRMAQIGERVPLYAGAASKVLLASLEDSQIEGYLTRVPLEPLSSTTIVSPTRLQKEIMLIRQRGYAEGLNERNLGGAAVAAPVRDHTGAAVAVLHISVPMSRYNPRLRKLCIEAVCQNSTLLSEELGYRTKPGAGTTVGRQRLQRLAWGT